MRHIAPRARARLRRAGVGCSAVRSHAVQRSVPGAERRGDDFGSPFFGLRFFGETKKGDCAAGRISRPGMHVAPTTHKETKKPIDR